jgi:hypothetical protein
MDKNATGLPSLFRHNRALELRSAWERRNRASVQALREAIAQKSPHTLPEKDRFYPTSQCFPSKVIIDAMQSITNYAIENDMTIISVGAGSGILEEHARLQGAKICCIELDSDCENRYELEDSETFFKGDVHRIQWLEKTTSDYEANRVVDEQNCTQIRTLYENITGSIPDMRNCIIVMIMPPPSTYDLGLGDNGMGHYINIFTEKGGSMAMLFFGYEDAMSAIEPYPINYESLNLFEVANRKDKPHHDCIPSVTLSVSRRLIQSPCCQYITQPNYTDDTRHLTYITAPDPFPICFDRELDESADHMYLLLGEYYSCYEHLDQNALVRVDEPNLAAIDKANEDLFLDVVEEVREDAPCHAIDPADEPTWRL